MQAIRSSLSHAVPRRAPSNVTTSLRINVRPLPLSLHFRSPCPALSFSTSPIHANQPPSAPSSSATVQPEDPPKLQITFTCTAPSIPVGMIKPDQPAPSTCNHRSSHTFTRHAYERGIVLIECPSCHNRHLIADHLGWFNAPDLTDSGKMKTIEDILRHKGEEVTHANAQGLLHLGNQQKSE